ncbi:hypothetical protein Marme_1259 [Marinomonas mediterranea MMB-1]|uniref:Uncharacterized protein n=1 Tax=Marinomonas mediterranea (strain ATCC 700492 / JCM 21426 / NBRC 103028 / MMB-1) TaxID=717774 RepID=F2JVI8_MARM1|nr:hypothetical protein Marme_1259 [Marinomonas mediterranea MMB-1]
MSFMYQKYLYMNDIILIERGDPNHKKFNSITPKTKESASKATGPAWR